MAKADTVDEKSREKGTSQGEMRIERTEKERTEKHGNKNRQGTVRGEEKKGEWESNNQLINRTEIEFLQLTLT